MRCTGSQILTCWILVLTASIGYSQDQRAADSLKVLLSEGELPDLTKRDILEGIIKNEGYPDELLLYSDMLIAEAARDSSFDLLQKAYNEKGNGHRLKGDYDLAFESYFKALQYATKLGDTRSVAGLYIAVGDTYSVLGDSYNANSYYQDGIQLLRKPELQADSIMLASAIFNAADELLKVRKLDSAQQYFLEAQLMFDRLNYEIGEAYALGSIGLVYAEQGRFSLAEASLLEATRMLQQLDDVYALSEYQFHLADLYSNRGMLSQAASNAESSLQIAQQIGLKEQIRNSSELLSQIYERQQRPAEALTQLKTYIQYRDSLNNESVIQGMEQQRREFEVAQKQLEVDLLNQQKRTQQIIGIALVVVLILGIVVLILTYKDAQRKKKLNRELSLLNQTKDKFFSIISHDLRGPMSAFYGISRIIRSYIERQQYDNLLEMTDQIDKSVRSVSSLLDNLLGWAIQQQGHFPYNPRKININDMCANIFQVFMSTAEAKRIKLRSDIPADLDAWADKNSASTILRNLIGNALKFTPEGGKITVTAHAADGEVTISVKDTGVGMAPEVVDHLFQLSERKTTFGTAGEKGVGLGLQLVYEFTQLNKGTVTVESTEGEGSTFTFTLPLATRVKEVLVD